MSREADQGVSRAGQGELRRGAPVYGLGGQDTNCQIGVFAAYVSRHGHALIDRALDLPKSWTDDRPRRTAAHVPDAVRFATRPRRAVSMSERAMTAGVPFAWVSADSIYGVGEIEMKLRQTGKGYVLGVNANSQFKSWNKPTVLAGTAEAIAQTLAPAAWRRRSAGEGSQGARLYDWAYLELADLAADDFHPNLRGTWTRGLLIRRRIADHDLAYFTTWGPAGTSIDTLVAVEGRRRAMEDSFETARTELGLDHNESRSWHGWHRHVSLVMLAFARLATIRHHANQPVAAQTPIRPRQSRKTTSSAGRSRRSAALPHVWRSGASSQPASSPGRFGGAPTRLPHNALI